MKPISKFIFFLNSSSFYKKLVHTLNVFLIKTHNFYEEHFWIRRVFNETERKIICDYPVENYVQGVSKFATDRFSFAINKRHAKSQNTQTRSPNYSTPFHPSFNPMTGSA
jgi:hypothetical protein